MLVCSQDVSMRFMKKNKKYDPAVSKFQGFFSVQLWLVKVHLMACEYKHTS